MLVFNFLVLTIATYCESKSVSLDNPKTAEYIATTSNINFVEAIKQDLKRNNDDYKEMRQQNVMLNNPKSSVTNKEKESKKKSVKVTPNRKGYRRKNGGSYQDFDYEDKTKHSAESALMFASTNNRVIQPFTIRIPQKINIKINHSIFDKRHSLILPKPNRIPNIYKPLRNFSYTSSIKNLQPPTDIPKFVNKNKIDKFEKFMKNNQGLLKKFVSSKQAALTQTPFEKYSLRMDNLDLEKPKFTLKGVKSIQRNGEKDDGDLPSPELLDMAPAVGVRVHKKREKGQLCHRHVLFPEGPKYDSRGRWYLPAHELVAKRPYEATRKPEILLPRCCNCCKKSVLGCE